MPSRPSKPKPKPRSGPWSLAFEAIGTSWTIEVYDLNTQSAGDKLRVAIAERIEQFDQTYSRFRPDSLVTTIAAHAGSYAFPGDAEPLLAYYRELYDVTAGAVTPLIGNVLVDAGYDANYSFKPAPLMSPPAWDNAMRWEAPILTTTRSVWLDFGAAGKGYLIDLVTALITAAGYQHYVIDAGGDMRYAGPLNDRLSVGLENPDDTSQAVGIAQLSGGALCGSAGNRRAWANFHHTIHPHTLASPTHIKAIWVTAATAMLADGLTTALYFTTPAILAARFQFEYAVITASDEIIASKQFPATFFTA